MVEELDNLFDEIPKEDHSGDQIAAFTTEGIKALDYNGNNILTVTEAGSKIMYNMEYLLFKNIVSVLDFSDKVKDIIYHAILNYHRVIIDFNDKQVFIPSDEKVPSHVYEFLKRAIHEYDPEIQGVFGENPEDYKHWTCFAFEEDKKYIK